MKLKCMYVIMFTQRETSRMQWSDRGFLLAPVWRAQHRPVATQTVTL